MAVPGLPERPRQVSTPLAIDIVCARALPAFGFFVVACVAFGATAGDADVNLDSDDVVVGACVVGSVIAFALDDDDRSKVTVWHVSAACDVDGKRVGVDSYFRDGHEPRDGAAIDVLDDDDGARRHLVLNGGRQRASTPGVLILTLGMIVVLSGAGVGFARGKHDDLMLLKAGARGFATVKDTRVEPGSGDSSDTHVVTFAYVDEDHGGVARTFEHRAHDVSAVTDDEREAILYRGDKAALIDALPGRPQLDGRGRFVTSRPVRTALVVGSVVVGSVVAASGIVVGVVDLVTNLR